MSRRVLMIAVAAAVLIAVAAVGALGVRMLWNTARSSQPSAVCRFGDYYLDTEQAAVAATMIGVVLERNLPDRAAMLTIAAALQESKIRNLASGAGDRDSVGVLQQRPSQGWGTIEQLNDLHYATGKFLDALVKVPNWQTRPAAEAIQAVQISIDGNLYAQHEGRARAVADAFTGKTPAGISCTFPKPTTVASVDQVAAAVAADLPINPPAVDAAKRTVTVPGAGWATTAWFVANADRLGIDSVSYADRTWSRTKGWQPTTAAGGVVVAVMQKS